jgi:hypothetical protein
MYHKKASVKPNDDDANDSRKKDYSPMMSSIPVVAVKASWV